MRARSFLEAHILSGLITIVIAAPFAHASWAPIVVSNGPGFHQQSIADGSGGSIVAWVDGSGTHVHHFLSSDTLDPAWPALGVLAGPGGDIVSDGAGGAIVWGAIDPDYDIYAYHVLASGTLDPAWPAAGVLICAAPDNQIPAAAVSDGSGGAFVVWADYRDLEWDLYAHHVRSTGTVDPAWPANGLKFSPATYEETAAAVSDGSGGVIVAWSDYRGADSDIYAQRLLSSGAVATGWSAGGQLICGASDQQGGARICTDGAGGAIVGWTDSRSGVDDDIYAMRVRATGALAQGWHHDGELVCNAAGNQGLSALIADGSGGAIAAWEDQRANDGFTDIYVQKVTSSGTKSWTANGVAVSTAPGYQYSSSLASDGAGGAFLAWEDRRNEMPPEWPPPTDLYLHHVLAAGSMDPAWTANGSRVTYDGQVNYSGDSPRMVANGLGKALVVWNGAPLGAYRIYAMNFTSTWTPLYPLNLTVAPAGTGAVTKSPDRPSYPSGSTVTLSATPLASYPFLDWRGDASGTANPLSIPINGPKNITAHFAAFTVTVAASPADGGSVTRSPDQSLYSAGSVTLTASAAPGFSFDHWTGDASGSTNPFTLQVNDDKSVTANFSLLPPSCGNWSLTQSLVSPSARLGAPLVWDPVRHRVLTFGGHDGANFLNDVWQFTLGSGWNQILPAGTPPSPRDAAGLIYDPVRDRLLVVCGNGDSPPTDVVALSLSGTPTWSPLTASGTPPPGLFEFSVIYDPVRDRVILFGGYEGTTLRNDTWSLSLTGTPTWTKLSPAGTLPPPRFGHVAVYDSVRDRMLVYGGTAAGAIDGDTYALSLGGSPTWSHVPVSGTQLTESAAVYDPIRDRMIAVGGHGPQGRNNGVLSLSLKADPFWSRLPVGGVPFDGRYEHGITRDTDSDVLLVFAGYGPAGYENDVKRLDCAGGWWLQTAGDHGSVTASPLNACYPNGQTVNLQAVPNSGYDYNRWSGDASGTSPSISVAMDSNKSIFAQFFTSPTGVGDTPLVFAIEDIRPNPNPGPVEITYSLPRAARVRLGVYDLAGRQIGRIADGLVEAGRHVAIWDGRSGDSAVNPGIYFIRYETPAGTWTKRLALLR
jgi:hypothetical protein